MKSIYTYLLIGCLLISFKGQATPYIWGPTGHRVVGKIADNYLSGKAKREVKKLLNRKSLAFVSTFLMK